MVIESSKIVKKSIKAKYNFEVLVIIFLVAGVICKHILPAWQANRQSSDIGSWLERERKSPAFITF